MILRLVRGRVAAGNVPRLLAALRDVVRPAHPETDPVQWVVGLRDHGGDDAGFLGLTAWPDYDLLRGVVAKGPTALGVPGLEPLIDDVRIGHFEDVGDPDERMDMTCPVLGLLTGTVRPNAEPVVHEMIRGVREQVAAAGVRALRVGQRVADDGSVEIAVLAFWADRTLLRAFALGRAEGAIDPRFVSNLTSWSFETYACLGPGRLMFEPTGPALVVTDRDGWFIDVSPGVEAILGIPGELLLHRALPDLIEDRDLSAAAFEDLRSTGSASGMVELRLPDGRTAEVGYRAVADIENARATWLLELPGRVRDDRPIEQIAGDAFGRPEFAFLVDSGAG